jgi:hypothetical protein
MISSRACLALSIVAFGVFGSAGCSASAPGADVNESDGDGVSEEALTTVTFDVKKDGEAWTALDAPGLSSNRAPMTCGDLYERDGTSRVVCTRGKEQLEILAHGTTAVVVHRPSGVTVDKRGFYTCKASGKAGTIPAKLDCSGTKARSRSVGGHLGAALDSTVSTVDIANTHVVGTGTSVLRGMAPWTDDDYADLQGYGIKSVLVFKNQTGTGHDVADEVARFEGLGLHVDQIPFEWKDFASFKEPCEQTVTALQILAKSVSARKKIFFHGTVGEDRTGYLAGLHRLLRESSATPRTMFSEELCERGYGSGNPLKPYFAVVQKLDTQLTPLFLKMAYLIESGKLTTKTLSTAVCATDPATDPGFSADPELDPKTYRCATSTAFVP